MKDFFKHVFATVVGIFVFTLIIGILGVMSIVGMVASGESTKNVSENSVLVLNLSGMVEEQQNEGILSTISGSDAGTVGLSNTLDAIDKAAKNENVKGIYMESGPLMTDYASAKEIRDALLKFKKTGKWIVAYGEVYTQLSYYIASAANEVYLNPQGMIDWHGIGAEPLFVKDLLAKVGVRMEIFKVGKFKSATEMFSEEHMSDANRQQTERYINSLWGNITKEVAASRGLSVAKLNEYADNYLSLSDQKLLKGMKLIDGLLYTTEVKKVIKKRLKLEDDDDITQLSMADMQNVKSEADGEEVAVYYAYGDIVDSPVTGGIFGAEHQIVGKQVCEDLQQLMDDDDVKAVVIRINSGGGSAYASEQMWHQIAQLKAKKPVVVSMGGMAASGGYYMSCNANYIVAQPTTLTGSIGIFGMIPDRSELLTQKLGIKFDEVKTNRNALFGTSARPMNAEEKALMQAYINRGYQLFRKRVADGRKLTIEQVENNAQGHVFTGEDALKLKLVDELGGLDVAVKKAAQLAKLDAYYTEEYPAPQSFMDQLLTSVEGGNYLDGRIRAFLGMYYEPFMLLKQMNEISPVQARIPFYLNIK